MHVLFDLGGVLVDFRGVATLARHLALDEEEMAGRWLASPTVRAFERGRIDESAFADGVLREFDLGWTPSQLRSELASWIPAPLPGALELLDDLAALGVATSCLSNTNALHWRRMSSWGLADRFRHALLSFELGRVKPDDDLFETATARLGLPPGRILFLDDHPANVDAARRHGWRAVRCRGPAACRSLLTGLGLLPAPEPRPTV